MIDLTMVPVTVLARELLARFNPNGFQQDTGVVMLLTEHPELGVGYAARQLANDFMLDRASYGEALRGFIGQSLADGLADQL